MLALLHQLFLGEKERVETPHLRNSQPLSAAGRRGHRLGQYQRRII